MTRHRNSLGSWLGFSSREKEKPATKRERARRRGEHKRRVAAKVKSEDEYFADLAAKARKGGRTKAKLDKLFHEVYGPEENPPRGGAMAQRKRKSKKKKNTRRKGIMPAALRKYWAKRRGKKNTRKRRTRRRRSNPKPRVRYRTRTVVKYRYRKARKRKRTTRRRNPPRRIPRHIDLGSGFTPKQIRKITRAIARATGKRTRVVKR